MISPRLEELILKGQADYITYAVGGSGVGTLPFPKKARMMIVVDFVWYPFYDDDTMLNSNPYQLAQQMTHIMTLWNGQKKSVFNFRDQFSLHRYTAPSPIITANQLQTANTPQFFSPYQHHCFLTSKRDIHINIYKWTSAALITRTFDTVPVTSPTDEQQTPNGYGLERAVRVTTTATARIISLDIERDPAAYNAAPAARDRNEYFDDLSATNTLLPPSEADTLTQCWKVPLINFGIVVINETAPPDIGF